MLQPIEKFFNESTVHALVHFTGQRRLYVKLIWFVAFAVSFAFCGLRIAEAFNKFFGGEVTTMVKEGAVDFEFPDLYICNESPISGSYSVSLSRENDQFINRYRDMINDTVLKYAPPDSQMEEYAVRMINSLPFKFLSDVLGRQTWQSIIDLTINDVDMRNKVILHHSNIYLNCFLLNLSDADRISLSAPASRLTVTLFSDPQVSAPIENNTRQDVFEGYAGRTNLKPSDWDFNYGFDYTRTDGFRTFITPKGMLPNDFSTQFVLGGGQKLELELGMEDVIMKPNDFVGQCLDVEGTEGVDYWNPYTGERETFQYEYYACLHREVHKVSKSMLNCSLLRTPTPWEYRDLKSCFNMTAFPNQSTQMSSYDALRSLISITALRNCRGQKPCKRRFYSFKPSSSPWPSPRLYNEYLKGFINYKLVTSRVTSDIKPLPGIQYLFNNASGSEASRSLMQMTLSADDDKCSETQLAVSYTINSLTADIGGLLGLFLGMSLLSVMELVELLHDCVLAGYHRYKDEQKTVEAEVPSSELRDVKQVASDDASKMPNVQ